MGETDTTEPTVILSKNQTPCLVALPCLHAVRVGDRRGAIGLCRFVAVAAINGWGLATVGILGALNLPLYEEIARRISWWQYHDCRMIFYMPYNIILANSDRHPAGDPGQAAHPRQLDNRTTSRSRRRHGHLPLLRRRVYHHRRPHPPLKGGNRATSNALRMNHNETITALFP